MASTRRKRASARSISGLAFRRRRRPRRLAPSAESDGHHSSVAQLSGQQLRAAEVRARLGNTGGYAPPKTNPAAAVPFSIVMQFQGEGRQPERIECTPTAPVIDGAVQPVPGLPGLGSAAATTVVMEPPSDIEDDKFEQLDEDV